MLLRCQGFHCCSVSCLPHTRVQENLALLYYDFLYYGAEKDDFVLLVSICFSFVCSDMNEVLRVIFCS